MGVIIKTKYKIARRLGAPIFEKTQTPKFTQSLQRRGKKRGKTFSRQKSDYAIQLNEKQKARFTYLISEKQFSNYVKKAIANKSNSTHLLFELLETRLDNVVYRAGFASTRSGAKQMVSHGHIRVNGKRVNVPSYKVSIGDKLTVKDSSKDSVLFQNLVEKVADRPKINWISFDAKTNTATVEDLPKIGTEESFFDLGVVIEFYSR